VNYYSRPVNTSTDWKPPCYCWRSTVCTLCLEIVALIPLFFCPTFACMCPVCRPVCRAVCETSHCWQTLMTCRRHLTSNACRRRDALHIRKKRNKISTVPPTSNKCVPVLTTFYHATISSICARELDISVRPSFRPSICLSHLCVVFVKISQWLCEKCWSVP